MRADGIACLSADISYSRGIRNVGGWGGRYEFLLGGICRALAWSYRSFDPHLDIVARDYNRDDNMYISRVIIDCCNVLVNL